MKNNNYIYVVGDKSFFFDNGNQTTYYRAMSYAKQIGVKKEEILLLYNEDELDYLNFLRAEKGARNIKTHTKVRVLEPFINANDDNIPPIDVDVPFYYEDNEGYHYEWLIRSILDVTAKLIYSKKLFDFKHNWSKYLKIIYLNPKNEYVEWKFDDYDELAKNYRSQAHKNLLAERKRMRERQRYDRLLKLREEGKITDTQRNELYKLEVMYREH